MRRHQTSTFAPLRERRVIVYKGAPGFGFGPHVQVDLYTLASRKQIEVYAGPAILNRSLNLFQLNMSRSVLVPN
jgi:hypothetical protein